MSRWQWLGYKTWKQGENLPIYYEFHFGTRIPAGATLNVVFRVTHKDSLGNTVVDFEDDTIDYTNGGVNEETTTRAESFLISNVPAGATFSIEDGAGSSSEFESISPSNGPFVGEIFVRAYGPFGMDWVVNPYNKLIDQDPNYGITYDIVTGVERVFEPLSDDAPGARYIFSFGDRLLALWDYGDRQSLAWSADGNITEWLAPDSGQIFLLDAQIDPVDDLMAGAHIGGGNFALYRKRSIWRGFETGNVAQAVGVVPWIAGIGTEFRFSVQIIPGGNIFLGSDSMVYILNESGQLTPVGQPILEEIKKKLTAENIRVDYDLVDSLFDSWLQEYWLAIPEDGAEFVNVIWIFDLGLFYREQKAVWRKRPMPNGVRRLAAVTMLPEPVIDFDPLS